MQWPSLHQALDMLIKANIKASKTFTLRKILLKIYSIRNTYHSKIFLKEWILECSLDIIFIQNHLIHLYKRWRIILIWYFWITNINYANSVSNGIKESQCAVNAWFVLDHILKFATAFKFKLELEVLHLEKWRHHVI